MNSRFKIIGCEILNSLVRIRCGSAFPWTPQVHRVAFIEISGSATAFPWTPQAHRVAFIESFGSATTFPWTPQVHRVAFIEIFGSATVCIVLVC